MLHLFTGFLDFITFYTLCESFFQPMRTIIKQRAIYYFKLKLNLKTEHVLEKWIIILVLSIKLILPCLNNKFNLKCVKKHLWIPFFLVSKVWIVFLMICICYDNFLYLNNNKLTQMKRNVPNKIKDATCINLL